MSLVPDFVYCQDSKFYESLTYWDPNKEWFICFDDDDPPELVIQETCKKDPNVILKELGIPVEGKIWKGGSANRVFGRDDEKSMVFKPANAFFFNTGEKPFPTPRPKIDEFTRVYDKYPARQGVYLGVTGKLMQTLERDHK